jgi:hypothetical protein
MRYSFIKFIKYKSKFILYIKIILLEKELIKKKIFKLTPILLGNLRNLKKLIKLQIFYKFLFKS